MNKIISVKTGWIFVIALVSLSGGWIIGQSDSRMNLSKKQLLLYENLPGFQTFGVEEYDELRIVGTGPDIFAVIRHNKTTDSIEGNAWSRTGSEPLCYISGSTRNMKVNFSPACKLRSDGSRNEIVRQAFQVWKHVEHTPLAKMNFHQEFTSTR